MSSMLANLLGSKLRAKVVGWLFAHPDERYFVRQLTGLLADDSTNISRELARLEEMGILRFKQEGRQKYYQANKECAIFDELCGLALKTAGLADVLREALAPVAEQIATAFVFGSMASGQATLASDVDLLIVSDLDEMTLHKCITQAEERLGRAVNYMLLSQSEFQQRRKEEGGFLARVLAGPKITILDSSNEIR